MTAQIISDRYRENLYAVFRGIVCVQIASYGPLSLLPGVIYALKAFHLIFV